MSTPEIAFLFVADTEFVDEGKARADSTMPIQPFSVLGRLSKKHPICNGSSSDLTSFKYLREADASEQSTEFPALLAHSTSVAPRICFSSESKTTWPFCLTSAVTLA